MKLISVKILGDNFRSLTPNILYEFNYENKFNSVMLEAKVFAGLNGSGKSNFLELLAEIFFYLDDYSLKEKSIEPRYRESFGFEIEYLLPYSKENHYILNDNSKYKYIFVRIRKPSNEKPEFSAKTDIQNNFVRIDKDFKNYLPSKIIGYTSGQNELLSNPFYKMKFKHFKFLEKESDDKNKGKEDYHSFFENRLLYIDNKSNFAIFIACLLLADKKKIDIIRRFSGIKDLHSFRITINIPKDKKINSIFDHNLNEDLNKIKRCATSWLEKNIKNKKVIILDFIINEATKKAFKFYFNNSFNLYMILDRFVTLNLYLTDRKLVENIVNYNKSFNINDELSQYDPCDLIFRIENIMVRKIIDGKSHTREIYYRTLSDGEHQFNEIMSVFIIIEEEGCLFLMDEPDTHFNPMWRSKMIQILNLILNLERSSRKIISNQEIIITTHSPFIVCDCTKENVYKFERIKNEVKICNPKNIETYGASISLILQELFDREITISDYAYNEIDKLRKKFKKQLKKNENIKKINESIEKLSSFGESIEKFDFYNYLIEKAKEIGYDL
jgi:restriction system-associated AAA family ATPase